MQLTEEEILAKCRSDEELINFRPSPNFKHKKYLRSKFEEAMMIEANSSCVEPNVSLLGHNKLEKVNTFVATAAVQPPLPPNPPPPDTPPMITNLKQEIEDNEYKCDTTVTSSEFNQSEELKLTPATIKTDQSDEPVQPTVTMCRNFARGTCKKGAACIFAHELILAQLPGVYTFCRNFQNSVCSFPKCKFVHSSVFEKEHFYRTGYLPPHALAHLKETTVQQPPPPPPQSEVASAEHPTVYCNAPPPPQISCVPPAAVRYNAEAIIEPDIFRLQPDTNTTSQKRDWSQIEEGIQAVSSPTRDRDSGEPLAKKCKNCGSKDLSERLLDAQIEEARHRNQERTQKIAEINKKNQLLESVLALVLQSNPSSHAAELQISADRDINNLSPNNNLRSMLAKMLMNLESGMSPGA